MRPKTKFKQISVERELTTQPKFSTQETLNILSKECSALSEENRLAWDNANAELNHLNKTFSSKTCLLVCLSLIFTAILASTFTFYASNNFDHEYVKQKLAGLTSSNGDQFSSSGIVEEQNLPAQKILSVANALQDSVKNSSGENLATLFDERIPKPTDEHLTNECIRTLKLSVGMYQKALSLDTNKQAASQIRKALFCSLFWLEDYEGALVQALKIAEMEQNNGETTGPQKLSTFYRLAETYLKLHQPIKAKQILLEALFQNRILEGASGGTYGDGLALLYVDTLDILDQKQNADAYINEFEKMRRLSNGKDYDAEWLRKRA
ncbi:MAG: hypothetical protein IAF58_01480, partial [Leptolyngbya sp.]|nr:hypothetical protein [Candidatus Melainabacteria bacterium]